MLEIKGAQQLAYPLLHHNILAHNVLLKSLLLVILYVIVPFRTHAVLNRHHQHLRPCVADSHTAILRFLRLLLSLRVFYQQYSHHKTFRHDVYSHLIYVVTSLLAAPPVRTAICDILFTYAFEFVSLP